MPSFGDGLSRGTKSSQIPPGTRVERNQNNQMKTNSMRIAMAGFLCSVLLAGGCSSGLQDKAAMTEAVKGAIKTEDVAEVPDNWGRYIARDTNGAIWFVTATTVTPLFSGGEMYGRVTAKIRVMQAR